MRPPSQTSAPGGSELRSSSAAGLSSMATSGGACGSSGRSGTWTRPGSKRGRTRTSSAPQDTLIRAVGVAPIRRSPHQTTAPDGRELTRTEHDSGGEGGSSNASSSPGGAGDGDGSGGAAAPGGGAPAAGGAGATIAITGLVRGELPSRSPPNQTTAPASMLSKAT